MQSISSYTSFFNDYLNQNNYLKNEPQTLHKPIEYLLGLGGKRFRPALVLLSADLYDLPLEKALDAAMAVEVFHNFSLMHDDIMDEAPLRRQKETVHKKWDVNTAILSGDAMLIWAYQCFESYEANLFYNLMKLFSKTAKEVCVGQQYDMDFESRDEVKITEYIEMIRLKTAVLVACAFQMGGILAEASVEDQKKLYEFGQNLGIAFQIQDDLLDVYGDPKTFGKQVGGDIIENKKTYLYLKALELSTENDKNQLKHLFSIHPKNTSAKIETVKHIYNVYDIKTICSDRIKEYTDLALYAVEGLNLNAEKKQILSVFAEELMHRSI
jgi:geranylgeranyl diphosphate synthase type II